MRMITLVVIMLVISGCASYQVRKYSNNPLIDRRALVPLQEDVVEDEIKDALRLSGWDVFVMDPANQKPVIYCVMLDILGENKAGQYWYKIRMINRRTGQEIFSITGKSTEEEAANKFRQVLHEVFG